MSCTLGLATLVLIGDTSLPGGFLGDTTGTRCREERHLDLPGSLEEKLR